MHLDEIIGVERVITHLALKPAAYLSAADARQIHGYIQESLAMIAPLRPSKEALDKLNNYLFRHKANQMQCIVAWTMFLDMHNHANLHNVPGGEAPPVHAA